MIHVHNKISRIDKKTLELYKDLSVATIYEASGRIGSVDHNIKPLNRGIKILGSALTVKCFPKDNLMLHKALEIAKEGDILVVSTDGYPYAGYWGGLMAVSGKTRKIGGLAIDGCIRDSFEISSIGFPIFCRGICIRGTTKNNLGLINHPILFGGVTVNPGDIVVGDDDGLVIVSKDRVEEVYEKTINRIKSEEIKEKALKSGVTSVELNNLEKVLKSLGMIEK